MATFIYLEKKGEFTMNNDEKILESVSEETLKNLSNNKGDE